MKEYTNVHAADEFKVPVGSWQDDPFAPMRADLMAHAEKLKETVKRAPECARVEAALILLDAAVILVVGTMRMGLPA